jgi:hypothetical protein
LLIHDICIGKDAVIELKEEAAMKRLIQIEAKQKKSSSVIDKNKVPEYQITTDPIIFCVEARLMLYYTLSENQVAGRKFERGYYYGKLINSVEQLLTEEWIQTNTDESFRQLLAKKTKYVYMGFCW